MILNSLLTVLCLCFRTSFLIWAAVILVSVIGETTVLSQYVTIPSVSWALQSSHCAILATIW